MNRFTERIPQGSLLFAPMEGITDEPYRLALNEAFPEWDHYFTDFLRIPSTGMYQNKKITDHFGEKVNSNSSLRKKTGFQILTSHRARTKEHIEKIKALGFDYLDLNLGCPSKKVNSHKGGAYLLSDLPALRDILKTIRENFEGLFTLKIRIGYRDDKNFLDLLKLFEDEGAEAITLHGRTRDQMYDGRANWSYIEKAVQNSNLPIIGNGDIWEPIDIKNIFEQTGCHGVMLGRGALKTPWLASIYKDNIDRLDSLDEDELLLLRKNNLDLYFYTLEKHYMKRGIKEDALLRRFKAFSRYLYDDFQRGPELRSQFLRSRSLQEFYRHLSQISEEE